MAKPDEEVKLILDAFQMSVSGCVAAPGSGVLRAQMQGRLMAVSHKDFQVCQSAVSDPSQDCSASMQAAASSKHGIACPCVAVPARISMTAWPHTAAGHLCADRMGLRRWSHRLGSSTSSSSCMLWCPGCPAWTRQAACSA